MAQIPARPLGDHPQRAERYAVKKGKYRPYVSHNGVNATIPEVQDPATITLEDAVVLLDARAGNSGDKPSPRRARRPQITCGGKEGRCQTRLLKDKPATKPKAAAKSAPKAKPKAAGEGKSGTVATGIAGKIAIRDYLEGCRHLDRPRTDRP